MGHNVRGCYHIDKLARLHELAVYVREPDKLAELQARSGNTLREKLRPGVPGERRWYDFLYLNQVFGADGQALLEELEAQVACDKGGRTQTARLARLHEPAVYVRESDKLAELQARSGRSSEKLRQLMPGEKQWYKFFILQPSCRSG